MVSIETGAIVLVAMTFFAAFVNGALGYGFSSLTVPVGLLFYTNRILNPALVLIEVFINFYVLFINRASVPAVWKRVYPILIGLLPGVAAGSYFLSLIHPGWLKFATYAFLLPLILFQAAGVRRPIRAEKLIGVPFGAGLGFLWFNSYPAQVFMGDVGALAIGASIGVIAVIVRQEVVTLIMGGVFVLETASVILQVGSFKLRGKRIFKMAPIHHHFELKGWAEPKVIVRFWIISLILVLFGLATLKLR